MSQRAQDRTCDRTYDRTQDRTHDQVYDRFRDCPRDPKGGKSIFSASRTLRWLRRVRLLAAAALLALTAGAAGARAQNVFLSEPVGTTSGPQEVTVNAQNGGGAVNNVEVLTFGAAGGDFAVGTGASACATANLGASGTCTESVTFKPTAPGLRMGAVVLLNNTNQVIGTGYISGTGNGGLGVLAPGNVSIVAGMLSLHTIVGDGGPATSAQLDLPASVVLDGEGNMYIADSLDNRVRMVCGTAGTPTIEGMSCTPSEAGNIYTIAGNGKSDYTGDGGPAVDATLNTPNGVAIDGAGNLYIADTGNNVIRVINAATGTIGTVAGNSGGTVCGGASDAWGDGCLATQAILSSPSGVTLDASGNLYIADTKDQLIREVSAATGNITTVAGTGYTAANGSGGYNGDGILATSAELNDPYAAAFDPNGNMYIPDSGNNRIREVMAVGGLIDPTSSKIYTYAGTGSEGGDTSCTAPPAQAADAALFAPEGVAVDAAGNVYIADSQNEGIRKVNSATGDLATLIQSGCGDNYANGTFTPNKIYGPMGMFLDSSGDLYFADYYDMVVQEIQSNYAYLDYTTPVRQESQSTPIDQTIENDGNAPLDLTAITTVSNSALDATNGCTAGMPYLPKSTPCTLAADFAPTTTSGDPLDGSITVAEDTEPGTPGVAAPNNPLNIVLVGDALAVNSTSTTISGFPNPSGYGNAVTFSVAVTTGAGTGDLTGTVSVIDTYTPSGSTTPTTTTIASGLKLTMNGAETIGSTSFSYSSLPVGVHSIVAEYIAGSDAGHLSCMAADPCATGTTQTVTAGTVVTLQSSQNPSTVGQLVTFTATVTASGGVTPDGTVTFMNGGNALGSPVTLTTMGGNQVASYTTSMLPNGLNQITADYSGDAANNIESANSLPVQQDVQTTTTVSVGSGGSPSYYGSPVTFIATITSTPTAMNPATGTVTFFDNGVSIGTGTASGGTATLVKSNLSVGPHNITATYAGDNYNSPGTTTTPWQQIVSPAQTSVSVTAAPSPGIAGKAETITAAIHVTAGVSTPTGIVTFTSGATTLGSAAVNTSSETATISPMLPLGSYQIVATYSGDGNDAGSVSSPAVPLTVVQATTQTTVSVNPSPGVVGTGLTFTATVTGNGGTPTGAVSFLAGGTVIGTANLIAGVATFSDTAGLAAGVYAITADYQGDTDDSASVSSPVNETVGTITTTTVLGTATSSGTTPQVILVASVLNGSSGPVPTGAIVFSSAGTALGSATLNSTGVASFAPNLEAGQSYSITAFYGGDVSHSPSTSQPVTVSGTATDFDIAISPGTFTMATSQNASVTIAIDSNGGFSDTIGLGCASLPNGVNCHFSPVSVSLPANGVATAQLTIDTNSPLSGGTSAMNRRGGTAALAGLFLPFSAFFGWLFWRLRKRNAGIFATALVLVLSAAALLATGCGGFSSNTVTPGTYTFQVTGTGVNSNVTHYQNITMTITQ